MIIELPPAFAYDALSEILSEDLFLPTLSDDEEYDMDGVAHKRRGMMGMRDDMGMSVSRAEGERSDAMAKVNAMDSGMLSDAELMYTSTSASESELEPFTDSGLESDAPEQLLVSEKKPRSRAVVTFTEQHEREVALHSPGKLLNTPRDSSRRYDYPFPSGTLSSPSDSPASTPAVSPFLAGTPSPASSSMSINSINLILSSSDVSAPRTPPIPIPVSPSQAQAGSSRSAATSPSSATHAHPKLSKFKPGDGPVPPSLRGRSIVFDSSALPHAMRSLPPTPTGVVTNPLDREGKRSRSQEPESAPGIGNLAVAPPLRKSVTAPSTTTAIESLTTMATCEQQTPDAALVSLPESPLPLCSGLSQNAFPGSTLTSSPSRTVMDTEVSFGLPPHASPLQVTLSLSSIPSYSPAPTVIDFHLVEPGLIDIGAAEHISLDTDDEIYYDTQEDMSPWPSP